MGNEVGEACEKCKHKCLLIHGKNRKHIASPPPIISFFKIMIGDKFSQFLYLPPKFGRTVSNLAGQKVYLEDSNGRQWGVTVSKINGSIAFKQGWPAFSLDHGLKFGEFVLFQYVTGSHFVVQIFDKTGCEKVDFPEEDSPNKRSRTDDNCISKDGPCHTSDKSSMNKQDSSTSAVSKSDMEMNQNQCDVNNVDMTAKNPLNCVNSNGRSLPVLKANYMEESYFMINRDLPCKQEDRSSIFDLSDFEMHCNVSVTDRSNGPLAGNERSSVEGDMLLEPQTKAGSVGKDPAAIEVPSMERPSNSSQFQTSETNNDFGAKPKISSDKNSCNRETANGILTTSAAKPGENKKDCREMLNKVIKRCQMAEWRKNTFTEALPGDNQVDVSQKEQTPCNGGSPNVPREVTVGSEVPQFSVPSRLRSCRNGVDAVKQELVELIPGHCGREEMIQGICGKEPKVMKRAQGQSFNLTIKEAYKGVKTEPIETVDLSPPIASNVSCLVLTNNRSHLELPACLPSFKGKMKANGNVVYLQDPVMRLWPVMYHERYNLKVLTTGWEAFSMANSIQQGDECLFQVESAAEGIFKVCIIRRF